jgi:hypothetical protein
MEMLNSVTSTSWEATNVMGRRISSFQDSLTMEISANSSTSLFIYLPLILVAAVPPLLMRFVIMIHQTSLELMVVL